MKKNKGNSKEQGHRSFADLFRKKDEPLYEQKEKGIRHPEDATSFLNEVDVSYGDYGKAEDMYDTWGLGDKEASVKGRKKNLLVGALAALIVIVLVVTSVFVILPAVLPGLFKGTNIELFVEKPVTLIYDDTFRVVDKSVCDVMFEPDPSSVRVTQVLYNEPVMVLADNMGDGYTLIRTVDGIDGYVKSTDLISDTDSVEPDLHEYKLVVSETSKNIMTHASQGTLVTQVMMNTVLYADVKRDGVYQVSLPGGGTGWIGSSGVIEIAPREEIEEVSCRYFVSSALSFVNSSYKENGMTMRGMSVNGMTYVCSCVNGIRMPRTMEEQMQVGVEVTLEYDVVTGELITDDIIPGDLVFFRVANTSEADEEYEMAVCTGPGTLLMVAPSGTTIRLVEFGPDSSLCERIVTVRRVFSQ